MDLRPPHTLMSYLRAGFWLSLPVLLLLSVYGSIVYHGPGGGMVAVPLHPKTVLALYFDEGRYSSMAKTGAAEPWSVLGFSNFWQQSYSQSAQVDAIAIDGYLHLSQIVYKPNGEPAWVGTLVPVPDKDITPLSTINWIGPGWQERAIGNAILQEPTAAAAQQQNALRILRMPGGSVCFCTDASVLEELATAGLVCRLQASLPRQVPYGMLLFPSRWPVSSQEPGMLPFYPAVRATLVAKVAAMLPAERPADPPKSASTFAWNGKLFTSLDHISWPDGYAINARADRKNLPAGLAGWFARIGDGYAGRSFISGPQDSLSTLREDLASRATGMFYEARPPATGKVATAVVTVAGQSMGELATSLAMARGMQPVGSLAARSIWRAPGNLAMALLGLPLPEADTSYWWADDRKLMITNHLPELLKPTAAHAERLPVYDAYMRLPAASFWQYTLAYGPEPIRNLQKMLPITASRLQEASFGLAGDRLNLEIKLDAQPRLARVSHRGRPWFVNLFNAPLKSLGGVVGDPHLGYAYSQTGRLYVFEPGKLSFLQVQVGPGLLHAPVAFGKAGERRLAVSTPAQVLIFDSLGSALPSQTLKLPGRAVQLALDGRGDQLSMAAKMANGTVLMTSLEQGTWAPMAQVGAITNGNLLTLYQQSDKMQVNCLVEAGGRVIEYRLAHNQSGWATDTLHLPEGHYEGSVALVPEPGTGLAQLRFCSQDGILGRLSLSTGRLSYSQLYKPEAASSFSLLADEASPERLAVVRQTGPSIAFYDEQGRKQYERPVQVIGTKRRFTQVSSAERWLSLANDTVPALNILGRPSTWAPFASSLPPLVVKGRYGKTRIGYSKGREVMWY